MSLTTHLNLVSRIRMSGAITLFPLHAFIAWTVTNYLFTLNSCLIQDRFVGDSVRNVLLCPAAGRPSNLPLKSETCRWLSSAWNLRWTFAKTKSSSTGSISCSFRANRHCLPERCFYCLSLEKRYFIFCIHLLLQFIYSTVNSVW